MAGLVPAIPISLAQCPPKRDRRNKPALGRDPSVQRSRKRYPFSRCVCIRVLPKPRQNFFRPFPRKRESSLGPRLRGDERRKSCLPKKGRRSADRRIHSWPRSFRARRQAQRSPPASRRSTAALAGSPKANRLSSRPCFLGGEYLPLDWWRRVVESTSRGSIPLEGNSMGRSSRQRAEARKLRELEAAKGAATKPASRCFRDRIREYRSTILRAIPLGVLLPMIIFFGSVGPDNFSKNYGAWRELGASLTGQIGLHPV
jgi:hypothetical protein